MQQTYEADNILSNNYSQDKGLVDNFTFSESRKYGHIIFGAFTVPANSMKTSCAEEKSIKVMRGSRRETGGPDPPPTGKSQKYTFLAIMVRVP